MNSAQPLDVTPPDSDAALLERVDEIAAGPLAALAYRIDQEGHYPLEIIQALGEAGALDPHLADRGGRFDLAIAAMQRVSRHCGTTGFLMWTHQVCALYMAESGNPALAGERLEAHRRGERFGGTALSNPMKALSGIERMALRARPDGHGGYRVSGVLPWVSHIQKGQYCGALARVQDDQGQDHGEIMFMLDCDDDVELRPCPAFAGMEGSSTWGIRLEDYPVGAERLIADPAQPFVARIRAGFILLQAGMALGVAQGSLDSILEVEGQLGHVNQFLEQRPEALRSEMEDLEARAVRLAATPYDTSRDYLLDVLDLRTQGAEFALRAAQSAMLHQGARGYALSAAAQRRLREAQFVAIVTPAIKHLRWEMDRLCREDWPEEVAS
ncbi:acyl-CoA/acyl-ACP dehydrogenase [Alcanivorax sp. MM125-6]|nr:acyl-CoA/acyl-ACP dehydrogenase [Alcanivorax sp. MM125-6]